jgi:hypothetical protein
VYTESVVTGGFGAEVAAVIAAGCFSEVKARIERVGAVAAPLPYAKGLERLALPDRARLTESILRAISTPESHLELATIPLSRAADSSSAAAEVWGSSSSAPSHCARPSRRWIRITRTAGPEALVLTASSK